MALLGRIDSKQRQGGGGIHVPPTDSAVPEIPCSFSIIGEESLRNCAFILRSEGGEGPIVPTRRNPLILLSVYTQSWEASITFTCQSICNFFILPHPTNYIGSQDKRLWVWCSWLSVPHPGHVPWGHMHACHPQPLAMLTFCHLYLCCPYPALPWNYAFQPPTPTLPRPMLSLENRSPINPTCMLIDSLVFNSFLHWQEEPSFGEFLP